MADKMICLGTNTLFSKLIPFTLDINIDISLKIPVLHVDISEEFAHRC